MITDKVMRDEPDPELKRIAELSIEELENEVLLEKGRKQNMGLRNFKLFRGDSREGTMKDFKVEVDKGMVVLDAIHRIQSEQVGDLAVRWNCKAGKCGSCSMEINGRPKLACMTRMNELPSDKVITIQPLKSFPLIKYLVPDVYCNYQQKKKIAPTKIKL